MIELFVPGRLCLFGEHSDWAAGYRKTHPEIAPGYCLVAGTDQGLRAFASPLPDALEIESRVAEGETRGPARFALDDFEAAARAGGFFSYALGVAALLRRRFDVAGLRLRIEADLPARRGLSSSAAVCVLVARAFDRVYGLGLGVRDEMELAYSGERMAGSVCGRMDQICAYGRRPVQLCFDGDALEVEPLAPGGPFHLLVVDLRSGKDTRRILADLNACFPDAPGPTAAAVRRALGPQNAAILVRARERLLAGDAAGLGALMTEAQGVFDAHVAPACPELRAPRLHQVLDHPALGELGFGGKGVGSQGDGCAQLVARDPDARDALARRLEQDLGVRCLPLTLRRPAPPER